MPNRKPPERSSRFAPPPGHCRSKPYSSSTTPHWVVSVALVMVGRLGMEITFDRQDGSLPAPPCANINEAVGNSSTEATTRRSFMDTPALMTIHRQNLSGD